jgi:hypothetical protein
MVKSTSLFKLVYAICFMLLAGRMNAQIMFSEINYHSDTTRNSGDWVELYNAGSTPVDISSWIFSDAESIHYFVIPPGIIMQPGSYFVLSNDTNLFRAMYPTVFNIAGPFNFGLGNKGDMLRLFDSQSILQISMTYADSAGWPKAADGHGRTLERRNMTGMADDPVNWYAGCMGGSPGTAPGPCSEMVIFSEINYHSDPEMDLGDWVELRNKGAQQIDLSGWILRDKSDSNSYFIPQGTILQPGQNLVVSGNRAYFEYWWWAGDILITGDFPFGLKNSKDVIRLFDSQGRLYFSVAYRSDGYWPAAADGGGKTLEILDVNGIANDGQNWFSGCVGGSPGKNYSTVCELSAADNSMQAGVNVYPNPFTSATVIELNNFTFTNEGEITVNVIDALGRSVAPKMSASPSSAGMVKISLERGDLARGIYFFSVSYKGNTAGTGKLVIED